MSYSVQITGFIGKRPGAMPTSSESHGCGPADRRCERESAIEFIPFGSPPNVLASSNLLTELRLSFLSGSTEEAAKWPMECCEFVTSALSARYECLGAGAFVVKNSKLHPIAP